eukprot:182754-Prymnesium_polylepis.1
MLGTSPHCSSGPSPPCLFGTVAPLPLRDRCPPASLGPSSPCLLGALAPLRCPACVSVTSK